MCTAVLCRQPCSCATLVIFALLLVNVAPYPSKKSLKMSKDMEEIRMSLEFLQLEINITLDALRDVKHHCRSNDKYIFPGTIVYNSSNLALHNLRKHHHSKILNRTQIYENGLTSYIKTFQHLLKSEASNKNIPELDQLERLAAGTINIRKEWYVLFYAVRHKNITNGINLCPVHSRSSLCMCASRQIRDFRRFLKKMYKHLRKLGDKPKWLRQLATITKTYFERSKKS